MGTYIQRGTRISVEVGTESNPKIVRWSTWGNGPFQQSYALFSKDGIALVDPVRPKVEAAVDHLDRLFDQGVAAVISTTPFHERHIFWFRQRYGAAVHIPDRAADAYPGKRNEIYQSGDTLPGGCEAVYVGGTNEEMVLLWKATAKKTVLIAGDAINGQTDAGGFDGEMQAPFHQVGGIRLRLEGKLTAAEMRKRYASLLDHSFDLILTGHNPKGITRNPKGALQRVLKSGKHDILDYGEGVCTYLWMDIE